MKQFYFSLLCVFSANAWSCSCAGIESIEAVLTNHAVIVEARVVSLEEMNTPEYGRQVRSVTLRVAKTLKGVIASETITVQDSMCYASLYLKLMKLGHTYVLPLSEPIAGGPYQMASCAHSGMELVSGKLYTFEQTIGTQRRLQFYKLYPEFLSEFKK